MNYSDKERAYLNAQCRVEKLRNFYIHLIVFIVVNSVISTVKIIRNMQNGESFQEAFFDWNTFGLWMLWGIGLAIHAFAIFGLAFILGNNWEEQKIKQFMQEEERNNLN
ncbi:2TM domain-containing protein [Pontimicrobium aquaticum]|uniref:2TM domain-containing protein n=1 Tax=Pontimicrobium aquaticum TaxID=2565367 RepID=A0A4U0EXT1_9FLAO|nr:2TM domain-containing protein [Pontimicrobium aquaticum]TJY36204.1 2TM domain-containing protein [Pontimicrobium aquaticum]